jgi:hypothetical protein
MSTPLTGFDSLFGRGIETTLRPAAQAESPISIVRSNTDFTNLSDIIILSTKHSKRVLNIKRTFNKGVLFAWQSKFPPNSHPAVHMDSRKSAFFRGMVRQNTATIITAF